MPPGYSNPECMSMLFDQTISNISSTNQEIPETNTRALKMEKINGIPLELLPKKGKI